jgi:antitoxin HicB
MQHTYKILLHKEPEGGYTVTVPALPGCVTYGETIDQSVEMAKEAIELYLESLIAHGDAIPSEEEYFEHLVSVAI